MYLHLGRDVVVTKSHIVGIFDLDTSTYSKHTQRMLARAEKAGRVVTVSEELPKSAVLVTADGDFTIYISQISSQTLLKRTQEDTSLLGSTI